MADIDQIIAGGAKTNANFNGFADPISAFFDTAKNRAAYDVQRAFKDGLPTDPSTGQPDWGAISKTLIQKGDMQGGISAANLGLQQQQQKFGQGQSAGIQAFESGGQPPQSNLPPSTNRNASVPVARPTGSMGGPQSQPGQSPPQGGTTIMQALAAQGIPNDQLQPAAASIARQIGADDPNAPIDINDPRIRNVLVPAIQQLKRMGVGQVVPNGQPSPAPQVVPQQGVQTAQAQSPVPQPSPQAAPQPAPTNGPAPVTDRLTTAQPPEPSRVDKAIAYYSGIMSNPMSPKQNVELAKTRLEALQKSAELTDVQKQYSQALLQGFKGTLQDFMADTEARKTGATEEAKLSSQKYQTLVDSGVKAQQEIPQLEMLQEQMNDPNFYSGIGEKYNLMAKRLQAAVGMNPDAAVPQEFLRKATAASVLSSFGALKGLGPIRVAEMNLAKQAAAAPENSIPANKLLVEIQKRTYQRQADIAEMAQNYKEQNGVLDSGFDKQVTSYFKSHPIFSDSEIKDFHKAIGEAPAAPKAAGTQSFSSPADVRAAVAAGKLKSGDAFTDPTGKTRYVP